VRSQPIAFYVSITVMRAFLAFFVPV